MGADFSNKDAGFGKVVYVFYYQLSKLSFLSQPFDYHVDFFYAILNPDRSKNDEKYLSQLLAESDSEYAASFAKVKMISLLLYKMNLLPKPSLAENQIHDEYLHKKIPGLHVGERAIEFRKILNKHWIWGLMASSKGMDLSVHLDLLWAYIAPYVTQEDVMVWNGIAKMQQRRGQGYTYKANLAKAELMSNLMDRSGLQFPRSMIDDGSRDWTPNIGD